MIMKYQVRFPDSDRLDWRSVEDEQLCGGKSYSAVLYVTYDPSHSFISSNDMTCLSNSVIMMI